MRGKHVVLCGLLATVCCAGEIRPVRIECLFDENPEFVEKLFRSGGGSVATAKKGDAFSGDLRLHVTPVFRGCEFFYDRTFVWEYGIDHEPVPGEFRYVLFAWRKSGGRTIQLGFRDDRSDLVLTYYAGEEIDYRTRANRRYIRVSDSLPREWEYVIRDMAEDLGGVQPNFLINGIYFIAGDGEAAEYDALYLSNSREALEQMVVEIMKGETP